MPGPSISGVAAIQQQLIAQLLQLAVAQAVKPAADIAALNLQLRAGGTSGDGVGELLDVYA